MTTHARPPIWRRWRSARRSAACGSGSRRWPGATTSAPGNTPGRSIEAADHPALGLILDSFHTLALGDDLSDLPIVPAEKIFFAQLADAPKLSMDVLSWSRHFRNFPGQGQLPVAAFTRDLIAAGYRGPLSLEIFNDEFRSAPARLMARDGLRSLVLVEGEAGATALPAAPTYRRLRIPGIRGR